MSDACGSALMALCQPLHHFLRPNLPPEAEVDTCLLVNPLHSCSTSSIHVFLVPALHLFLEPRWSLLSTHAGHPRRWRSDLNPRMSTSFMGTFLKSPVIMVRCLVTRLSSPLPYVNHLCLHMPKLNCSNRQVLNSFSAV